MLDMSMVNDIEMYMGWLREATNDTSHTTKERD